MFKRILPVTLVLLFQITHYLVLAEGDGYGENNGGNSGTTVTVSNAADFRKYAESASPYIIMISGTIDVEDRIQIASNKTICGVDSSSTVIGAIEIRDGSKNVIVKYLNITNPAGDGITIREGTNVFVSHCNVYDCGDGCIDVTVESDFVTISYCKFYYKLVGIHKFVNLIGADDANIGDRGKLHVTFHHNWWAEGCAARMPMVRYGRVHIYNNYFSCEGNQYCSRSRIEAEILSENNYYLNVRDPLTVEDGGKIKSSGNIFNNCTNTIYPGIDSVFSPPYTYTLDSTACARTKVISIAGNTSNTNHSVATLTRQSLYQEITKTVEVNNRLPSFFYVWRNATSATITGLPPGVDATVDEIEQTITIRGIPTQTGVYIYTVSTLGICATNIDVSDTITVTEATSIPKNSFTNKTNKRELIVYPNPVQDNIFTIELANPNDRINEVVIYNIQGDIVYYNYDLWERGIKIHHHFNKGLYFLQIKGKSKKYTDKLVIQ